MKYRTRTHYTDSQRALMWGRWRAGRMRHQIGQLFDRPHTSIQNLLIRCPWACPLSAEADGLGPVNTNCIGCDLRRH